MLFLLIIPFFAVERDQGSSNYSTIAGTDTFSTPFSRITNHMCRWFEKMNVQLTRAGADNVSPELGGKVAAAVDEECGDADSQQPQNRGFRGGLEC